MSKTSPEYVRVYQSLVDDPKFANVYDDDHHFATWVRLLMAADAMWPASANIPIGTRKASLSALVTAGLIDLSGSRFRIHGLDDERERRANVGRAGGKASGASRTNVERTLNERSDDSGTFVSIEEKRREEPRKEEKSRAEPSARDDILDDYYRLTTRWPKPALSEWLERLSAEFGYDPTSRRLADQFRADPSAHTLMGRVENELKAGQHAEGKIIADREAERAKAWAKAHSITPEQAAENRRKVLEIQSQWSVKEPA